MGWDLLVSGVVQATPDKLQSSYSVMTYHKEGPACGKIPCEPTSSEVDCEYPLYFTVRNSIIAGRVIRFCILPDFLNAGREATAFMSK